MSEFSYQPIPPMSRAEVEAAIGRDDPDELLIAVLSAALHSDDLAWAERICVTLSGHSHFNVRGNAVLGFGHLARIHGSLAGAGIRQIIEAALTDSDQYVRGQADSAADDVEFFLGWKLNRQVRT